MTSATNNPLSNGVELVIKGCSLRSFLYKNQRIIAVHEGAGSPKWDVQYGDLCFVVSMNAKGVPAFVQPADTWFKAEDLSTVMEILSVLSEDFFKPIKEAL